MKLFFIILTLLLLGCQSTPSPQPNYPQSIQIEKVNYTINWLSYEEAFDKSKKTQKPLFIFFSSKSCKVCQYMKSEVLTDFFVKKLINDNYIPVLISDEINEEDFYILLDKFELDTIPTFIIQNSSEKVLLKISNGLSPEGLKTFLTMGFTLNKVENLHKMNAFIESLLKVFSGKK
jgi:thioredoxin-related protein